MKQQSSKRIVTICLIVTCVLLAMGGNGFARGKKGEWKLPAHYPDGFDGYGCLMKITQSKVVIDDSQKKLSPEVTFHTPDGNNMPREYITANSIVGYMLDSSSRIVSLWLVRESCGSH